MKLKLFHILLFAVVISFTSCGSSKEIVYFQDEIIQASDQIPIESELIYKPNDLLTIVVSGLDPEAVKPFNLPVIANNNS